MTPQATLLEYWKQAMSQEFGIILTLSAHEDKRSLVLELYQARKRLQDPAASEFMLAHPGDNILEVWIVRKTTDLTGLAP